jgi:hypothetical protein
MTAIEKYPRTRHIQGSRLQPGDEDLNAVPLNEVTSRPLVIEEKLDGANCGVSFAGNRELRLQSRGHYLTGGAAERQFNLLKSWATRHQSSLRDVLGRRYIMYGEWLYAKHTIFYDALPHYFLEFDIWDREQSIFLDTPARKSLIAGLPVVSVPVIASGTFQSFEDHAGLSRFKTPNCAVRFAAQCDAIGYPLEKALRETDSANEMEGLYVKWEEDGEVKGRYKFVRPSFLTAVVDSGSHWQDRPVIPNLLAEGVDLFA